LCYPFQKQETNAMTPETQNPPKKPYAVPQLLSYGNIREITRTAMGDINDNPGGGGGDVKHTGTGDAG
jgi:hypothetical protein